MAGKKTRKFSLLNVAISAIDMQDAYFFIADAIRKKEKTYICVCPVSTLMACKKDPRVMKCVNSAGLATPDGMPVVWLGRILGNARTRRVYGPELMENVFAISEESGHRHFLFGSTREVLRKLEDRLKVRFPRALVCGSYAPPFGETAKDETEKIINAINTSSADIVWVGLGSPKQDLWMGQNREVLNAPVLIGVGAAFDFLSGAKPQAPAWLRNRGFEWLFRLIMEPKRLWRRYLVDGILFIIYAGSELFSHRLKLLKKPSGS